LSVSLVSLHAKLANTKANIIIHRGHAFNSFFMFSSKRNAECAEADLPRIVGAFYLAPLNLPKSEVWRKATAL
jgi:hypothetical protein